MLELGAFFFESLATLIARMRGFRHAPVTSAVSIAVILFLVWALAISWVEIQSAQNTWLTWPVAALEGAGIHPGIVFTALVVASIPAYCFEFHVKSKITDKET